jgi:hypothetical protein
MRFLFQQPVILQPHREQGERAALRRKLHLLAPLLRLSVGQVLGALHVIARDKQVEKLVGGGKCTECCKKDILEHLFLLEFCTGR